MHRLPAALIGLVLLGGASALPPPPPVVATRVSASHAARYAGFVDQSGRAFDPARLVGKPVLMNFIFAGCGTTCPMQSAELAATLKGLPAAVRRDVRIVSVSVDPRNDTPRTLRRFAEGFGATLPTWSFLTGNRTGMLRLVRAYEGAGAVNGEFAAEMHSTDILLLGGDGRVIRRYRALPLDRARVRHDLETLATFPGLRR